MEPSVACGPSRHERPVADDPDRRERQPDPGRRLDGRGKHEPQLPQPRLDAHGRPPLAIRVITPI